MSLEVSRTDKTRDQRKKNILLILLSELCLSTVKWMWFCGVP